MGRFFSNLYVFNGSKSTAIREKIATFLMEDQKLKGFQSTTKSKSEHAIWIGSKGRWVTLLDPESDRALEERAKKLSLDLSTHVLCAQVYDSDDLLLHLYRNGELAGEYVDCRNSETRFESQLTAEAWGPLLLPKFSFSDFDAALNKEAVFAEDRWFSASELLGIDESHLGIADDEIEELSGFRALHFSQDASITPVPSLATGLPRFGRASNETCSHAIENKAFGIHLDFQNSGGAGKGAELILKGGAVANQTISFLQARLRSGYLSTPNGVEEVTEFTRENRNGEELLVARFPETPIDAAPGGKKFASMVLVRITVRSQIPGAFHCAVQLAPLENIVDGRKEIRVKWKAEPDIEGKLLKLGLPTELLSHSYFEPLQRCVESFSVVSRAAYYPKRNDNGSIDHVIVLDLNAPQAERDYELEYISKMVRTVRGGAQSLTGNSSSSLLFVSWDDPASAAILAQAPELEFFNRSN